MNSLFRLLVTFVGRMLICAFLDLNNQVVLFTLIVLGIGVHHIAVDLVLSGSCNVPKLSDESTFVVITDLQYMISFLFLFLTFFFSLRNSVNPDFILCRLVLWNIFPVRRLIEISMRLKEFQFEVSLTSRTHSISIC